MILRVKEIADILAIYMYIFWGSGLWNEIVGLCTMFMYLASM